MQQPSLLNKTQRQSLDVLLNAGWKYECSASSETSDDQYLSHNPNEAICKSLEFSDFNAAFAFMTQIAMWSERKQHHPDWHNVYSKINIRWSTHDVHGLSTKDIEMANICDELYRRFHAN